MSESSLSSGRRGRGRKTSPTSSGDKPARRRSTDKRDRIMRAAVKVFARNGFHATRVSEVAKAAGVADGTIYLYFKSKEELLVSLFEDRVEKLLTFMRQTLPKDESPPRRLRRPCRRCSRRKPLPKGVRGKRLHRP